MRLTYLCSLMIISLMTINVSFAHTQLQSSQPSAGASLSQAPSSLQLTFTNPIQLIAVSLYSAQQEIEIDFSPQTNAQQALQIPLPNLAPSQYQVKWRGLGEDGHLMKGDFGFELK
ncbi:copper resistance CopC family protein [Motilimonas eburnea]|uniref:copper resistance CopC family protein n=1 Tax=Motilimonas eburnea TaxID=1737488 RepID=UPI001E335248|nr:copper resistance CopC family protein [Motilimonas eburnea]MCE2571317.1 copper resistance protein CopC [Motilimonas eburnea]